MNEVMDKRGFTPLQVVTRFLRDDDLRVILPLHLLLCDLLPLYVVLRYALHYPPPYDLVLSSTQDAASQTRHHHRQVW